MTTSIDLVSSFNCNSGSIETSNPLEPSSLRTARFFAIGIIGITIGVALGALYYLHKFQSFNNRTRGFLYFILINCIGHLVSVSVVNSQWGCGYYSVSDFFSICNISGISLVFTRIVIDLVYVCIALDISLSHLLPRCYLGMKTLMFWIELIAAIILASGIAIMFYNFEYQKDFVSSCSNINTYKWRYYDLFCAALIGLAAIHSFWIRRKIGSENEKARKGLFVLSLKHSKMAKYNVSRVVAFTVCTYAMVIFITSILRVILALLQKSISIELTLIFEELLAESMHANFFAFAVLPFKMWQIRKKGKKEADAMINNVSTEVHFNMMNISWRSITRTNRVASLPEVQT